MLYDSDSCHLQKFSDDSAVLGCIREGEEGEYRTLVDNFVEWSEQNHLRLNVSKIRECKKGMSRLYFLRKLRSFNVFSKMLEIFY